MINSFKKNFAILLMISFVAMLMTLFSPTVSHATNINDPNKVKVFDANGNLSVSGGGFDSKNNTGGAWGALIDKYKVFITGIAGIGAVTMVVLFIIQFMKLGASAGNPNARSQALVGCLWTGIAATGLGAVTLIVGFFYNAVQ